MSGAPLVVVSRDHASIKARMLALCGVGAALLAIVGLQDNLHVPGELGIGSDELLDTFMALGCIGIAAYFVAVRIVLSEDLPRYALGIVLAVAALLRVVPLAGPSFLSTDSYRYVWDGRVQVAGINPYRYIPSAPELTPLRDAEIYPFINRADYAPTIYPPVAQMVFAGLAWLSPHVRTLRIFMVGCEAVSIFALVRVLRLAALPPARVLIYAWNPMFVWEYAGNGHVDALAILGISLALWAVAARRAGLAAAALAAATLVKFLPVVLFPAIWRDRRFRMVGVFAAVVLACYAVYASVGLRVFGFLGGYAHEEGLGSGSGLLVVRALEQVVTLPHWAGAVWIAAVAAVLAAVAIRMVWFAPAPADGPARVRRIGADAALLATITTVGLSPHYAWYFGWLGFLACLAPWRSLLWLSAACLLLYQDPIHTNLLGPTSVYVPFVVLAIRDWLRPASGSASVTL